MKKRKRIGVRTVFIYAVIAFCIVFFLKIYLVNSSVEMNLLDKSSGLGIEPKNDFICPDGTPTVDLGMCGENINKFTLKSNNVFSYEMTFYTYKKCPVEGIKKMYVLPGFLHATVYITYEKDKSNCEKHGNYSIDEKEINLRYRPLFVNVIDERGKTYINVSRK